jgi:site-specific DNA-methyltransferase (adenine-specific)
MGRRKGNVKPCREFEQVPSGTKRRRPSGSATSDFGAGRKERHDSGDFYRRFLAPTLSEDENVVPCPVVDRLIVGDARDMGCVESNSVALVVTSPPYFAGKEYEKDVSSSRAPKTFFDYLDMLAAVFEECFRVLEPGGRIAINVANLGRRPFRPLSADLWRILERDLGLMPRGEIVWVKGEGSSGNLAWGSFAKASNPVLRDISERILVASKGRFDRSFRPDKRERMGLPHESTIEPQEFMAATLDVWKIRPASARRIGHPAPFPVELPERLIRLYTYKHDVVLDPFVGSGSTAVAAARNGRHYLGFDTHRPYVDLARSRVREEGGRMLPLAASAPRRAEAEHAHSDATITGGPLEEPHF